MKSFSQPFVASAVLVGLALPSRAFAAVPPPEPVSSEEVDRYESKDRKLVGATAGLGAASGLLLIIGLALHGAAIRSANRCAADILDDFSDGPVACEDEINRIQKLTIGRDVALIGFGLTAAGTIVTGVLLGVHRSRPPSRVSANATGVTIRF